MVLSNITVPLLGLVDAAVIGHLDHSWYLGGVALGSTMISVAFWLLGFLRMSTTGLTAQAVGAGNTEQVGLVWLQGMLMAFLFALLFLALHQSIIDVVLGMSDASEQVKDNATIYFSIRVWGAPAALCNFVLLGWLLGTQNAKAPMWMVIVTNITNIVLDVCFVLLLGWKVEGVALASLIADYMGMFFGVWCSIRYWRRNRIPPLGPLFSRISDGLLRFIGLNRDIFFRSLCLQAVFSFMTFQGAAFGDQIIAANAVLMSFLMIISYGMDGFAYAIEAMVGKAIGKNNPDGLKQTMLGTIFWSGTICILLTVLFWLLGQRCIRLLTDIEVVRVTAYQYLPWLIAMPLVSLWCFLMDGLFIGATKGKEMRNGMIVSLFAFFGTFFTFSSYENHALWLSMLVFMAVRGITLIRVFIIQWRRGQFLKVSSPTMIG
jgi:MATE family multidrug resistance protein